MIKKPWKILRYLSFFLLCYSLAIFSQTQKSALLLTIDSAIGPATQDFVHRGIQQAIKNRNEIIILELNTPGGLDKAMRGIVSDILASSVPVAVYVAPSGARAASAGTYILYASHVAAMAPGTHLGAATPVSLSFPGNEKEKKETKSSETAMDKKILNDAMAYIRGLAQLRGRNVAWGEKAVSQGASLSADEALQMQVIDIIAKDVPDLLKQINGRVVAISGQQKTLQTDGMTVTEFKPTWHNKFLSVITDPSVAYILLMIGIWGLFFEFANPGFVLPGVFGAISLLVALYAFQLLPINYVGLGLILLGIGFMIAEVFVSSFGALGIGGIIAFIIGSVLLLDASYRIPWEMILVVSILTGVFFFAVVNLALKSRFKPVVSGREELIGVVASIMKDTTGMMRIRVKGELWQVKSSYPLEEGQKVKVIAVNGVTLVVEPIKQE